MHQSHLWLPLVGSRLLTHLCGTCWVCVHVSSEAASYLCLCEGVKYSSAMFAGTTAWDSETSLPVPSAQLHCLCSSVYHGDRPCNACGHITFVDSKQACCLQTSRRLQKAHPPCHGLLIPHNKTNRNVMGSQKSQAWKESQQVSPFTRLEALEAHRENTCMNSFHSRGSCEYASARRGGTVRMCVPERQHRQGQAVRHETLPPAAITQLARPSINYPPQERIS